MARQVVSTYNQERGEMVEEFELTLGYRTIQIRDLLGARERDVVGVLIDDVDVFCEALKAFRDEVTKPKMTGGERVFAARREARGATYSWSDCPPDIKAYYQREAELLGIKDDE